MDRTSAIILLGCFILLLLWGKIGPKIFAPPPAPPPLTNQVSSAVGGEPAGAASATNAPLGTNAAAPAAALPVVAPATRQPEELAVLQGEKAVYTITSRGGGIKQIELVDYPAIASAEEAEEHLAPRQRDLRSHDVRHRERRSLLASTEPHRSPRLLS